MVAAIVPNPINHVHSQGTQINDILGKYGLPGGLLGAQVDALAGNPLGVLSNLKDAFQEAALGRGTNRHERVLGKGLPPFGFCPHPKAAFGRAHRCHGYAKTRQRVDLAPGAGNDPLSRLFNPRRRSAAQFERALRKNPFLRRAFERALGGKIRMDSKNDGKLTIERRVKVPHFCPPGMHFANHAAGMLGSMDAAIKNQLGAIAGLQGGFGLGALNQLGGGLGLGLGALNGLGGSSNPNTRPGLINNNGAAEERAHQNDVAGILNDPSLTVEDKITMMIMAIMKKMDKDIQEQGQHINKIQQQQNNKSSGGGQKSGGPLGGIGGMLGGGSGGIGGLLGGAGGILGGAMGGPLGGILGGQIGNAVGGILGGNQAGAAGQAGQAGAAGQSGESKSIDVETMKLKRMIDKRSQMFDMLRQIIDKYNETSKGIIQSIGR